jgi:hypothetical protein
MFQITILSLLLTLPYLALAQSPIPRQGDSCPTGTYKSGDYCTPFKIDCFAQLNKSSKCLSGVYL